jgi:hypothetical protein
VAWRRAAAVRRLRARTARRLCTILDGGAPWVVLWWCRMHQGSVPRPRAARGVWRAGRTSGFIRRTWDPVVRRTTDD